MEKNKIYNLIILDASASMTSIYRQALTGVNETLATIRQAQQDHPELLQYVTLASFSANECFLNRIYSELPIEDAKDITAKDYPLLNATALYDAMGTCITELQKHVTHSDRVLVTVITDGYENASRYWRGPQVKALVEELRSMGWTFTYIGADQDVEAEAFKVGINNSLRFSANAESTKFMFDKERSCRSKFYFKVAQDNGNGRGPSDSSDYFADDDDKADGTAVNPYSGQEVAGSGRTPNYRPVPPQVNPRPTHVGEKKKSFFQRLFGR